MAKVNLRGLILSAVELRQLTQWPSAVVEDYLNLYTNLVNIVNQLDAIDQRKVEEIPTDFIDGAIPFVDGGLLIEDVNISWDTVARIFAANGVHVSSGRRRAASVVSSGPYTPTIYDEVIYIDTTAGDIDITLPVGIVGASYRLVNTGTTGNKIIVTPNGTELLFGVNASEYVYNGETIDLTYELTAGWF